MNKRTLDQMENNQTSADREKRVKVVSESESSRPAILVPLLVEVTSEVEDNKIDAKLEINEPDVVERDVEDIIEEDEIIADAEIITINMGDYYYRCAQWYLEPCEDTELSFAKQDPECMWYVYELLHRAVALKFPFAYLKLARLYEEGKGQFKNINKSIQLLEEALELEDILVQNIAATQLGIFYEYGTEVEYDLKKAMSFYKQAADKGGEFAAYSLGRLYDQGKDVDRDLAKAREYLEKASEQDYDIALFRLYQLYGEVQNREKTIDCLQRLIALGEYSRFSSIAALELAYLYQKGGMDIKPDYKLAFDYFKQAAQWGEPVAQWEVAGKYLIKLIAGKYNLQELLDEYKSYLAQAAKSGFSPALKELNAIDSCWELAQKVAENKSPRRLFSSAEGIFLTQEANQHRQDEFAQQIHPVIVGTLGMIARLHKALLAQVCAKKTILEDLQQELNRFLGRLPKESIKVKVVQQVSQAWLRKNKFFKKIPLSIKSGIFS